MKQIKVEYSDKAFRKLEKLAAALDTDIERLITTISIDAADELAAQVAYMKKREDRALANRERGAEVMNKIFAGIGPDDDVEIDPKKAAALADKLEEDRKYNLTVSRRNAVVRIMAPKKKVA